MDTVRPISGHSPSMYLIAFLPSFVTGYLLCQLRTHISSEHFYALHSFQNSANIFASQNHATP